MKSMFLRLYAREGISMITNVLFLLFSETFDLSCISDSPTERKMSSSGTLETKWYSLVYFLGIGVDVYFLLILTTYH